MKDYRKPEITVMDITGSSPLAMSGDGSEQMGETVSGALGIEGLGNGGSYVW